jgi:hypothetical protein
MADHDHVLDLVLVCRECGLVMADQKEAKRIEQRLIRFVAPRLDMTSDNLTSVETTSFVFDVQEQRHG